MVSGGSSTDQALVRHGLPAGPSFSGTRRKTGLICLAWIGNDGPAVRSPEQPLARLQGTGQVQADDLVRPAAA